MQGDALAAGRVLALVGIVIWAVGTWLFQKELPGTVMELGTLLIGTFFIAWGIAGVVAIALSRRLDRLEAEVRSLREGAPKEE